MPESESHASAGRVTGAVLLGWLAMIGFDFLLHGGVLARLYVEPHPFLLPPAQAFKLIPLGYLSFLLLAVLLAWLIVRLRATGWRAGARLGLKVGALIWASLVLGLASISTASHALLVGWFAGQTIEAALAGGVIGAALSARRLRGLVAGVIVFVVCCAILTVVLQVTGLAPAAEIAGERSALKYASKKHFIDRIESEHATFVELADSLPKTRLTQTGAWGEGWTIKDLFAHLTEWEQICLGWHRQGLDGIQPEMPAPGYKWNETPHLNHDIWKKHERTSWKRIRAAFDDSYEEILAFAKSLSERELLTPGVFAWTKKHPLTTYLGANTCSHYSAATKILKRWVKEQV